MLETRKQSLKQQIEIALDEDIILDESFDSEDFWVSAKEEWWPGGLI